MFVQFFFIHEVNVRNDKIKKCEITKSFWRKIPISIVWTKRNIFEWTINYTLGSR